MEDLNKEAELVNKLDVIDKKYAYYFSKKENVIGGNSDNRDNLHNYYIIQSTNESMSFSFINNPLPSQIQEECRSAFKEVYGKDH
jgi:hypothetical protein